VRAVGSGTLRVAPDRGADAGRRRRRLTQARIRPSPEKGLPNRREMQETAAVQVSSFPSSGWMFASPPLQKRASAFLGFCVQASPSGRTHESAVHRAACTTRPRREKPDFPWNFGWPGLALRLAPLSALGDQVRPGLPSGSPEGWRGLTSGTDSRDSTHVTSCPPAGQRWPPPLPGASARARPARSDTFPLLRGCKSVPGNGSSCSI
jgi:hypothetical protein